MRFLKILQADLPVCFKILAQAPSYIKNGSRVWSNTIPKLSTRFSWWYLLRYSRTENRKKRFSLNRIFLFKHFPPIKYPNKWQKLRVANYLDLRIFFYLKRYLDVINFVLCLPMYKHQWHYFSIHLHILKLAEFYG